MIPFAYCHPAAAAAGTASTNTRWSRRLRMKQSCHVHLLNPLAKCPEGPDASLTPDENLQLCWRNAASRPEKIARMMDDPATLAESAGSHQVNPGDGLSENQPELCASCKLSAWLLAK